MTRLLHISASPRGEVGNSSALASAFLHGYRTAQPNVRVDHFDLFDGALPTFGSPAAQAKMAVFAGAEPVGPEQTAWRDDRAVFDRFAYADAYLFSVPMWN